jgi:uncharacterized protein
MSIVGGKWQRGTALVTGASAGIGEAFARRLAAAGCNLILSARRRERLEALRDELAPRHGVVIDVVPLDLATPGSACALHDEVRRLDRRVDLLVNNAGYGLSGRFVNNDEAREMRMIQLNAVSLVELTRLFLPEMVRRRSGDVLLVSSIAAYLSIPTFAVYAATKAFVTRFGEALGFELRGSGVHVTVVNPGGTESEFLDVAGMKPTKLTHLGMMTADRVAVLGLRAMERGRRSVITGLMNKVMIWLASRFLWLGAQLRAALLFQRVAGGSLK